MVVLIQTPEGALVIQTICWICRLGGAKRKETGSERQARQGNCNGEQTPGL